MWPKYFDECEIAFRWKWNSGEWVSDQFKQIGVNQIKSVLLSVHGKVVTMDCSPARLVLGSDTKSSYLVGKKRTKVFRNHSFIVRLFEKFLRGSVSQKSSRHWSKFPWSQKWRKNCPRSLKRSQKVSVCFIFDIFQFWKFFSSCVRRKFKFLADQLQQDKLPASETSQQGK